MSAEKCFLTTSAICTKSDICSNLRVKGCEKTHILIRRLASIDEPSLPLRIRRNQRVDMRLRNVSHVHPVREVVHRERGGIRSGFEDEGLTETL